MTMTAANAQTVALALGRYWGSADTVSMTDFGDCVRNDFKWSDGAHTYMLHDTKAEALEQMAGLGFSARVPA